MKSNTSYKFIRFGGLSQMDQSNRYGNDNYHSPPTKKGIYAFPIGLVDRFLLTATNDPRNESNKTYWLKDDNGNKIKSNDFFTGDYDKKTDRCIINKKYIGLLKKRKIKEKDLFDIMSNKHDSEDDNIWYVAVYKKPRIFDYNGDIWCHLIDNLRPEHIIDNYNSWVKVSIDDYITALKIEKHQLRKEMIKLFGIDWMNKDPFKYYNTDHLEVFIEKIN